MVSKYWDLFKPMPELCYLSQRLLGHIGWVVYVLESFASFDYCHYIFHQRLLPFWKMLNHF